MKKVEEALSLILEDWALDNGCKTFDLLTEDIISTKSMFCTCLDDHDIKYQMLDNKLIIGNKKIYIYQK